MPLEAPVMRKTGSGTWGSWRWVDGYR
jgi:hypothetical protein